MNCRCIHYRWPAHCQLFNFTHVHKCSWVIFAPPTITSHFPITSFHPPPSSIPLFLPSTEPYFLTKFTSLIRVRVACISTGGVYWIMGNSTVTTPLKEKIPFPATLLSSSLRGIKRAAREFPIDPNLNGCPDFARVHVCVCVCVCV